MPRNFSLRRELTKLIIDDILKVIYAPQKAFKTIIANPKYLGALIVLLLFIAVQVGYEYSQFSKTYTEQTTPAIDQLSTFTNATLTGSDNITTVWRSSSNVALTNNFDDYFNYSIYVAGFGLPTDNPAAYYSLFGNSSLGMSANNTNTLTAALDIESALNSLNDSLVAQKLTPLSSLTVDCSPSHFQNLSITLKQVQPQAVPQSAAVTLYSLSDTDYYVYDLTSQLSNTSNIGQWTNLTLTLGPNATGWTPSGNPTWGNITALKLDFAYPSSSTISIQIGALFFHGEYLTPIQYNSTGILLQFLQLFSLQFIFAWFIMTGIIFLICKYGLKAPVTWKPLFIGLGMAMFVMVIRGLVNLGATFTMPTVYYPFDLSLGVRFDPYAALYFPQEALKTLPAASTAIFNNINAATATFRTMVSGMFIVSYVWLGALGVIVIGELKPEFSMIKRIVLSAVSLAIVVLILIFFVGAV
jgi:hypothetical protein